MNIRAKFPLQISNYDYPTASNYRLISWLLTMAIVLFGLQFFGKGFSDLLLKLYELLIQKII